MTAATAGAAQAATHWPVTALEIALAVALFAVGLLIDRHVSKPGTARGPRASGPGSSVAGGQP